MNGHAVLVGLIVIYFQVKGQILEPHMDPQPAKPNTLERRSEPELLFLFAHGVVYVQRAAVDLDEASILRTNKQPPPGRPFAPPPPPASPAAICELLASRQVPICATCFQ